MMAHILTKSSYIKGLQCEKALFLSKYKKSARDPVSEALQKKFDGGRSFEEAFRDTLGSGINITQTCYFNQYVNKTQQLIDSEEEIIFEATFVFDDVLIMVDALVRLKNGTYKAYEVKNSPELKPVHRKDLGVQWYVLSHSIPKLIEFNLVLKGVDGEFVIKNLLEELSDNIRQVEQDVARLKQVIKKKKEPQIAMGEHCHEPYTCDFLGYCSTKMF